MHLSPSDSEATLTRLRLRDDLRCSLQSSDGQPYYLIEDQLRGRFFRFGLREWEWARQLDGQRTIRQVVIDEVADDSTNLSAQDKWRLCQWLWQMELVRDVPGPEVASRKRGPTTNWRTKWWLNPLFMRIPLLNPDRLLTRCLPWFRWTLTPVAFGCWLVICLLAWGGIWLQHERFAASVPTILAANNWLFLLLAWVLLKTVHEFYHGLTCKKYGGYVPRCGLVLILFSPVAFVDVTSSWRFRSKWHRIYTAAAGMYVELFVASLAAHLFGRGRSTVG